MWLATCGLSDLLSANLWAARACGGWRMGRNSAVVSTVLTSQPFLFLFAARLDDTLIKLQ